MDPNATLVLIRTMVSAVLTEEDITDEDLRETAVTLANAVDDLDQWVTGGGNLPTVWNASHPPF
jgi:hypothetical protein